MKNALLILVFVAGVTASSAQVEHVHSAHPVYAFLERASARGQLAGLSMAQLPLQRQSVIAALRNIRTAESELTSAELDVLLHFEREFGIAPVQSAVVFPSRSDSSQVFFAGLFSEREKFLYRNRDSANSVSLQPLLALDLRAERAADSNRNVLLGQAGLRLYGTLSNCFGYYLQVSNGAVLNGNRSLALDDPMLSRNVKFGLLDSDFDFSDSHIRFDTDWFYGILGRERRRYGSGFGHHVFVSDNAPPADALILGARFDNFEYRFMHAALVGLPLSNFVSGPETVIPAKYLVYHRFAYRGDWGELAFVETVVYNDRSIDLAYLNPLSFFKSIEHSLRDRDNSALGIDGSLRPFKGLELRAGFYLDDLRFEKIGTEFWGNKTAWNIGANWATALPLDVTVEYARVLPYTYSHFNAQNSVTNDGTVMAGILEPNSDEVTARLRYWWGGRYPIALQAAYRRHGRNIYDENGELVFNAGGDVLQTKRSEDPETIAFLDGALEQRFSLTLSGGIEIVRGFNIQAALGLVNLNGEAYRHARLLVRFEDF